ncbi:MAG TPA: type IV toxin-antitoxin system AbiEi family antitoxin, partial [bacterium]|nr:type IV toxin-antitoxin system AbiEi family antitoxin [bacterium]
RIVRRNFKGPNSTTQLIEPKDLLRKWIHNYQIFVNQMYFYLFLDKLPLKKLMAIAKEENWQAALTGYEAANQIQTSSSAAPPMIYLWPKSSSESSFRRILSRLENQHRFIPVGKDSNLIILEPFQKEAVFYGSRKVKGLTIVSPIQLFLDLYGMDQGKTLINSLAPFWEENKVPYEI